MPVSDNTITTMNRFPYQITNIHTNSRHPGFLYATIVDDKNQLCVSATLDYCVNYIKEAFEHSQVNNDDPDSGGIGGDADPGRDYEGENRFGPD